MPMHAPAASAPLKLLPATCPGPDAWARTRISRLRPELRPDSATYTAALVLLCAQDAAFNIERLARRTCIPRQRISAFVRRLYDNGVWVEGGADCVWNDPAQPEFWNDVAVAEGRMIRRRTAEGGVEWAEPGAWRKAYDFVQRAGAPDGTAVQYLAAEAAPEPEAAAEPEVLLAAAPPRLAPRAPRTTPRPASRARIRPGSFVAVPRAVASGPRAPAELFPRAVWLC